MRLYGVMVMVDQHGNEIDDEDIFNTCMNVYQKATDLINETLIPVLNDVLYGERTFPLEEHDQAVYERHGDEMFNTAYKYIAYSGVGKVPGENLFVYPVECVTMDLEKQIFYMKANIEKL